MSKSFKISAILIFLKRSPLVAGSLVLFTGTGFASLANYLYHLLMGRMLGPSVYGELESVIAVLYLLIILSTTLALVTAKFTADLKGKNNSPGIKYLFSYFTPRLILWGGIISLLLILISPLVGSFLHLKTVIPLVLGSLYFFTCLPLAFNRGILQGMLKFKEMAATTICENGLKLIIAVILVWGGFRLNGAVASLFLSGLIAWAFTVKTLAFLRKVLPQATNLNRQRIFHFAIPALINNLAFTSLYTTDVILVKHFFNSYEAGWYAALAVLGKIIFFAASPITAVMFPLVSNHKSQNKNYRHLLFGSLALVFLICLGAELIYWFFPQLMVRIMFGNDYLPISPLLAWMGAFISFYSLAFLVTNFFLSADKTGVVFLPVIAGLAQVIFIGLFHQTLQQVIIVSTAVSGLLLGSLILFYWHDYSKTSNLQ